MDFVKNQIAQIQQQLNGLTASQKMLTGTLVAIMVMTLLWWGRYAGEAEMVPLLNQSLSADDIVNIKTHLATSRITHKVVGDRIMVPAESRLEALADLGFAQLLPQDTRSGLELIEDKMGPFDDKTKTDALWNQAKQTTLANIIRRFPGVASASVLIDPTQRRVIGGGGNIDATASINITMRSGQKPSKKIADAAATLVAGAQANLKKEKIQVIIDGLAFHLPADTSDMIAGGTFLERKRDYETYYANAVRDQLSYIPGVMVQVTVDLNIKSTQEQSRIYDNDRSLHKVIETRSSIEENSATDSVGGEPGAGPNITMSVDSIAGAGGTSSTSEQVEERFQLIPAVVETSSRTPAGKETVIAASVAVPRSYFVGIYKHRNNADKEPDDAVLQPLIDIELEKIRRHVKACTALKDDNAVTVETYTDLGPVFAEAAPQTVASSLPFGLGDYTKEIAIGVLAVVSLFMLTSMVRKSTPAPAVAMAPEIRPTPQLHSGEAVAGEVGEGNPLLQGMELDEDAVQAQQMLEQVSTMVKDNPDAAANLVKRWLNRS